MAAALIVRWAVVDLDPAHRARLLACAEDATRARVARLHRQPDRDATLLAHGIARMTAAGALGCAAYEVAISRICPSCASLEHGRPTATGPAGQRSTVSITHTSALVAAVAGAGTAVGIDAETGKIQGDWQLSSVFAPREAAAIEADPTGVTGRRLWARKEALLKLAGVGLGGPAALVDACDVGPDGGCVTGPCPGWVIDLDVGNLAAVAIAATTKPSTLDASILTSEDLVAALSQLRPAGNARGSR